MRLFRPWAEMFARFATTTTLKEYALENDRENLTWNNPNENNDTPESEFCAVIYGEEYTVRRGQISKFTVLRKSRVFAETSAQGSKEKKRKPERASAL